MNWLCWHVGTVNDPKFGLIADVCRTSRANVIAVWAVILESARDGRGSYSLTSEDASYALGIEVLTIENIHSAMIKRGLVDGETVNKWPERQGNSNSERAREWRERRRTSPNVAERSQTSTNDPNTTDRQTDRQYTQTEKDKAPTTDTVNKHSVDDFSEWYSAYPKKVAKGAALKAYNSALKKTDHATLVAGARRYASDPKRKPDYTANPATWLNSERWLDEANSNLTGGRAERKTINGPLSGQRPSNGAMPHDEFETAIPIRAHATDVEVPQ